MKIFISHASVDRAIAEQVVDLLLLGTSTPRSDIFFSSAAGNIPNGKFFVEEILAKLNGADLIVALLSPSYMRSKFCLGEVGAAQARRLAGVSDLYTLLIPPADFHDMDAVLYGTQSGKILDANTIDLLLERVVSKAGGGPNSPMRYAERDKFLTAARPLVNANEARSLTEHIKLIDVEFFRDPTATYKMKLRTVFRNETGKDVTVSKPRWSAKPSEIQILPDLNSAVQVELGGGWIHAGWSTDAAVRQIGVNRSFRTWIGLNWAPSDEEFRRLHEQLAVGTLILPMQIEGCGVELEVKL